MILPVGKGIGSFCDLGVRCCVGGHKYRGQGGGRVGVVVYAPGNRE